MNFTADLLVDFLNSLISFDSQIKSVFSDFNNGLNNQKLKERQQWEEVENELRQKVNTKLATADELFLKYKKSIDGVFDSDAEKKKELFLRLQKCKSVIALIESAENSITSKLDYNMAKGKRDYPVKFTVEDLISFRIDFIAMSYEINKAIRIGKKKDIVELSARFSCSCNYAVQILNEEIAGLRKSILQGEDNHTGCNRLNISSHKELESLQSEIFDVFNEMTERFSQEKTQLLVKKRSALFDIQEQRDSKIHALIDPFCVKFSPQNIVEEYEKINSLEPSYDQYKCAVDLPSSVHLWNLKYDISGLRFCDYTREFLNKNYYLLYENNTISMPLYMQFESRSNYMFKFDSRCKNQMIKEASRIGMRLFMMLPPGKVNFTFADPVGLGESFAMFTRLVNVDDRTSVVINGKIWSDPRDIEDKLRIMTGHISNVTQRCLQGQYDNIIDYNKVAGQNAEAYQIVMLMDFPAGLTDQSLQLLEQILVSGPKCGVFTFVFDNKDQYSKIPERTLPLVKSLEKEFQIFSFTDDSVTIEGKEKYVQGRPLELNSVSMPSAIQLNKIVETLRKGIASSDKVVIGIEEMRNAEVTNTTKDGIRIPIGIHGANDVQYLTLGVGGSHHALIAGLTRSGKSSLLHTIIMCALKQYKSPDELNIYLVDFKRGVEFKIYADYVLPIFKVIAIETEREFGYSILETLEREQKIRADLFKRNHVDKIQEYRELPNYDQMIKMPRIVLIMDEFHELFSNNNDEIGKKSSIIMERIVRQGAAFGIHLILASQSYSNITGLDRAVFDQMAVRIVLKCSKADANLLLDGGSAEIDQISIDDPGRAVYNSEAGNKEYNSHFRVAYIAPEKHRDMLQEISDMTISYADKPTRILLSNIEDNKYSIFNQFATCEPKRCPVLGRLYIGELLSVTDKMNMDLVRSDNSNLLMLGNDTEKARSMFAFAILSLCINYWVQNRKAPEKPFIYLLNCKPLNDSYFKDTPQIIASKLLPQYVRYVHCGNESATREVLSELHDNIKDSNKPIDATDKFFFVFGYQRAEELKSETKLSQGDDIDGLFNLMPSSSNKPQLSPKEIFHLIVKDGAKRGIHVILWQDSYSALEQGDNNIMSYFNLKVAFDMSPEEFSRSVGENDISLMSEHNAIYYNKARDNQKFRPYQAPDEEWLNDISAKLH